ncbi:acyl-CoA reductase [Desulfogranum mediterraneum]|uniref:acyl-CoA reductase n=1 Tax=Desulfogranum mediterraneum TaxID=160661 RepID=UPI0004131CAB|nr:acyl-CoA reductase [Desulfogranum mediterraneum]
MAEKHLWQGQWITDEQLEEKLEKSADSVNAVLGQPFPLEYFLELCQTMHEQLEEKGELYDSLLERALQIQGTSRSKAEGMLESIVSFLAKAQLQKKMRSELGTSNPFHLARPSFKEDHFESWAPMGVLVHIAPTNVFTVGILCVVEGLLSGNINILKTSASQHQLPQLFFATFLKLDTLDLLKPYIIIAEISSKQRSLLAQLIRSGDVVSAWGSEEAIKGVRAMTPQGVRFVEWGHKISFAYFSREHTENSEAMRRVCEDICLIDQNACSSPQDVFVECDSFAALKGFAENFAQVLAGVSQTMVRTKPESGQQAEISTVISVAETEQALGLTHLIQANDHSWCVIADQRPGLAVSPLYRTIWIKPLLPENIVATLHPMKRYLQTVALIAPTPRVHELSRLFLGAGCLRIKPPGQMHANYIGEPHDGVYALPWFMKRVSLELGTQLSGVGSFEQFETPFAPDPGDTPLMDKATFQQLEVAPEYVDLTFKSGGSSGKTTYSYFTYEDYHAQMRLAALGLYAAGLDPKTDRVINMFAAGHLYGGFVSFWSILEHLGIPQYPMGVVEDLEEVGRFIVEKRINTIFSLPTLIMKLFETNADLFQRERPLSKLFFGGDHFGEEQVRTLREKFGVRTVRAAAYGSNDAGPLGYQCPACRSNEYHLLGGSQSLEVFAVDGERPVEPGAVGRLIFSSKQRSGQQLLRYDVGDFGFLHPNPCGCGRMDPKFTLLGRSSDTFKAGGPFLRVDQFATLLQQGFGYTGLVQIVLDDKAGIRLTIRVEPDLSPGAEALSSYLLTHYEELHISVSELGLQLIIEKIPADRFESVAHSGKIRHLLDKRSL